MLAQTFEASVVAVPELQASVVDLQASTLTADDRSVSAARKADEIPHLAVGGHLHLLFSK